MNGYRKEITNALYNVALLCDQFIRKYPNYSFLPQPIFENYNQGDYNNFQGQGNYPQMMGEGGWIPTYPQNLSYPPGFGQRNQFDPNYNFNTPQPPQKNTEVEKQKYEKQIQLLRQKNKLLQIKGKGKRSKKMTLKQLKKQDSRYNEKPKYPLSPYFLFLQERRKLDDFRENYGPKRLKQFAEDMGKQWRSFSDLQKSSYLQVHAKQRQKYNQQLKIFYDKYPDLAPKKYRLALKGAAKLQANNQRLAIARHDKDVDNQSPTTQLQTDLIQGQFIGQQQQFSDGNGQIQINDDNGLINVQNGQSSDQPIIQSQSYEQVEQIGE